MSYHVSKAHAGPREIWGYRFSNLRDAMETAEDLSRLEGIAHTVWEMKSLYTFEPQDPTPKTVKDFRKAGAI
jgi:hypothetical protein